MYGFLDIDSARGISCVQSRMMHERRAPVKRRSCRSLGRHAVILLAITAVSTIVVISSIPGCDRADNDWADYPVLDQPPTKPVNPDPENGAEGVEREPDLKWDTSTDPDGDDSKVSYDVYFGDENDNLENIGQALDTTILEYSAGTPLYFDHTYYWRVVACDESAQTNSSDIWSFTTVGNQPPTAPVLTAPTNDQSGVSLGVTLQWTCSQDIEGEDIAYDVYIDVSYLDWQPKTENISECHYTPGDLAYNTKYYWQVIARDESDNESHSDMFSFTTTTNHPPTAPVLREPGDGDLNVSRNADLEWYCSTDEEDEEITYDVYLGTSLVDLQLMAEDYYCASCDGSPSSYCVYDPGELVSGTQYFWRIVARDASLNEASSDTIWFRTR